MSGAVEWVCRMTVSEAINIWLGVLVFILGAGLWASRMDAKQGAPHDHCDVCLRVIRPDVTSGAYEDGGRLCWPCFWARRGRGWNNFSKPEEFIIHRDLAGKPIAWHSPLSASVGCSICSKIIAPHPEKEVVDE